TFLRPAPGVFPMRHVAALVLTATLAACGHAPTAPARPASADMAALGVHAHEVLVKLAPGAKAPGHVVRTIPRLGWSVLDVGGEDVAAAIARFKRAPGVVAAEPQQLLKMPAPRAAARRQAAEALPNDPDLGKQQAYFERI